MAFGIATFIAALHGIDTKPSFDTVATTFGGELALTALIRILQKDEPKNDKGEG